MIQITLNQMIYLLSLLPSVQEAYKEERYLIELMIPSDVFSSRIITQFNEDKFNEIEKRTLSDVKKIQFRLNIHTAYPTWEPTTDLIIKGQRNEQIKTK